MLAATAADLHDALRRVAEQGWSHVVLDGKLFPTDQVAQTTTSVRCQAILSAAHPEGAGLPRSFPSALIR